MPVLLANNATSLLAGAIDAAATTLSVENADAALFPNPAAGEWFPLTIVDNAGNMEIVKATARAGAIITVQRAQEGTTAKAFAAGARVDLRATAAALNDVGEKATTKTVGAAMAGANGKQTPADGDFFGGVEAGGSTMFKTTWGNIKAAITAIINAIVSGNMNGRAYPRKVGGGVANFNWSGQSGQPTWVWGGLGPDGDAGNYYVWNPANFNVASVGGWNINAIINQIESRAAAFADDRRNQCVTDTRFAGYVSNVMAKDTTWSAPSGYVFTAAGRNSGDQYTFYARQPQVYIANQGWRAQGAF